MVYEFSSFPQQSCQRVDRSGIDEQHKMLLGGGSAQVSHPTYSNLALDTVCASVPVLGRIGLPMMCIEWRPINIFKKKLI